MEATGPGVDTNAPVAGPNERYKEWLDDDGWYIVLGPRFIYPKGSVPEEDEAGTTGDSPDELVGGNGDVSSLDTSSWGGAVSERLELWGWSVFNAMSLGRPGEA
jgi:hypothetical protein